MKFKLLILFLTYSAFSYSQCFDCGHSIGGHIEDYVVDIDKATDGIILTYAKQGEINTIKKYDYNCNLIWSSNSISSFGRFFRNITLDDNDNIYSIFSNPTGTFVVNGVTIEQGSSLIKLNYNGSIEWAKKISDDNNIPSKVHLLDGYLFVVGQLHEIVSNNIGLTIPNGYGSQYFSAKFDLTGNFVNAEHYGGSLNETYFDSQIDEDGNIYLIGTLSTFSNHTSHLLKINSSLSLLWSQELSNNPADRAFRPMTIYYNNTNGKLYIWSKYYISANFYNNSISVSNNCDIGSVIMEVSKSTGDLENYKVIDNCGFYDSVGNGIGNVEQRSFITHNASNLYILSSFRGEITIGNQTINTSIQNINSEYNTDLILHKIDLLNFSHELVLRSEGENTYPEYYDLAGPLIILDDTIYLTSSYTSKKITINGNVITNNSGNGARDVLFYKHKLNQDNLSNLISYENTCFTYATEFNINGTFDSVLWNFDDPASSFNNTSTLNNPNHTFTDIGSYNVTAIVTCGTEIETINIEVVISENPLVNQIDNIYACEDEYGSQISSTFDTSTVESDLIGNQSDLTIKYIDSNGIELPSPLPNPMSNSTLGQETIIARVAYNNNLTCFTEITFDLIVNTLPEINEVNDIHTCDDNNDGIAEFDISNLETIISNNQPGMIVEFFHENGQQLPNPLPITVQNIVPNQETITARITDLNSNCYNESSFDLIVNPLPELNQLQPIYGCDDNNDGISEYFNTSTVGSQVLNGQTEMTVSYFDQSGIELPNPLPNPYTNSNPFNELIIVRVTDNNTACYAETTLQFQTVTQPNINQPSNLYACDQGNGYAEFDTSSIEQELIGNQTGLTIQYYDSDNNPLPSPLPELFPNTESFSQTINVRVEDVSNPVCYSETSFDLIVNELPEINLEDEYNICNLEPSIKLNINSSFNSYNWLFEDGTQISSTNSAEITEEGSYTLTVTQIENGITCENLFEFSLTRSVLPEIQQVNFGELGNNYIEIIASGEGDFEYSIDGVNYQDSNYFSYIQGGMYTVFLRDKDGCGQDSEEVVVIDYPKFFTPNNDGYNDFWQIKGIVNFPNSETLIFNRYGKLLARISSNDLGWDGFYNGKSMMSNDYWFRTDLGNGRIFSGHFSLKR